jgi:hypothetical protein
MSGERIDMPRCANVAIDLGGGVVVHGEAGVLDLASLLPPGWAPLDGVISLATLEHVPFTLDLPQEALVLETASSLAERIARMRPLMIRDARPGGGAALDVFVAIDAEPGPLWLILDTGNIDRTILAPHAARALGHEVVDDAAPRTELEAPIDLPVSSLGAVPTAAVVMPILYDGNLGVVALERYVLTFDLARDRAWAARALDGA